MVIQTPTSDSVIWNIESVITDVCFAMQDNDSIVIDLLAEGPDLHSTGLYDHLAYCGERFGYDLSNITVLTCNPHERHPQIIIDYQPPFHFVLSTKEKLQSVNTDKDDMLKHFGIFIGRSNAPRLLLSTYLNKYNDKTIRSFHYDPLDDFHRNHIGLEESIKSFDKDDVTKEANFISLCPIVLNDKEVRYPILKDQHNDIYQYYKKFFVEIVCETYYSGTTFFPTEKTWRPIVMKTPFVIQGPEWYTRNLQDLGFQTFGNFWDEGYSEDPSSYAILEIQKVIDIIKGWTVQELNVMYNEMKPILEHNYETFMNLTPEDFLRLRRE